MELTQEEKAIRLQQAVLNSTTEEICNIYDTLGYVEMSAPALGLACRFRGLEVVKVLVEKGATFDFPSTEEIEIKYHCHIGEKHANYRANYRTNYSLYLLKCFRGGLKGARCLQGMKFVKKAKRDDGTSLSFLADKERIAVLNYLLVEREKLFFQPEEMLFFAIFAQDTVVYKALKEQNIMLSEQRVFAMTEGTLADGYWFEFSSLVGKLADKDYIDIMQQLSIELSGKSFRFTQKMFDITQKRFYNINIFAFFLAHFRQEKMKKYEIIRSLIDENAVDALAVVEREGWLTTSKKRDEMIAYASQNQKTEALAWLLDFKNRTADIAAEQEKLDRKLMRELNAAPGSVAALRQIWNFRKQENGTLIITGYKGAKTEVIIPEKIGKNIVVAIGKGVFSTEDVFKTSTTREQIEQHKKIIKIVLPETIVSIGKGAFCGLSLLEEINIPEGVKEIGANAFYGCCHLSGLVLPEKIKKIEKGTFCNCRKLEAVCIPKDVQEICEGGISWMCFFKRTCDSQNIQKIGKEAFSGSSLRKLIISGTVKIIEEAAFANCRKLKEINICEGVEEIGKCAFYRCQNLKSVTIPKTVKKIEMQAFVDCRNMETLCICEGVQEIGEHAFSECNALKTVTIPGTVFSVKQCTFFYCKNLEKVYICEGVEELQTNAFGLCNALKEVYISASVKRLISMKHENTVYEPFGTCTNLTVICPKGSPTEIYCKEKGFRFRYSDIKF